VSSNQYYITLLNFLQAPWLQACIIQGIIHSITSGTEEVMRVSRAALIHSTVNGTLKCGVVRIHETLVVLLEDSYTDDRQATPLLETIAFLMEQQIELGRMGGYKLPTRKLWNVVRKAHFKSTSIRKLEAAVRIYGALATQDDIRRHALRKLSDLLLHPYPTVSRCHWGFFTLTREEVL
jgi:tubulin-specific chaperone D